MEKRIHKIKWYAKKRFCESHIQMTRQTTGESRAVIHSELWLSKVLWEKEFLTDAQAGDKGMDSTVDYIPQR